MSSTAKRLSATVLLLCLSGAAAVGAKERIFVDQWSPTRRWVQVWRQAGPRLERVRREELRRLDPQRAIALLCGEADYTVPPRAPRPTSGLIEQQRWFMRATSRGD